MKLDLSFAELHTPLFLGGVNWGLKLQNKMSKGDVKLAYDRDNAELLVSANGKVAIIPTSNVVSMTPMPESLHEQMKIETAPMLNPLVNPPKGAKGAKKNLSSQASTPQDHVFSGPGKGKTNDK